LFAVSFQIKNYTGQSRRILPGSSRDSPERFGKSDLREIFRRIEEESRSHTLCMARFDDEGAEKKIRKAAQTALFGAALT
jgi:hypothetical protein